MDYKMAWGKLKFWLAVGNEVQEYFMKKNDYYRVGLIDGYKRVLEVMKEMETTNDKHSKENDGKIRDSRVQLMKVVTREKKPATKAGK